MYNNDSFWKDLSRIRLASSLVKNIFQNPPSDSFYCRYYTNKFWTQSYSWYFKSLRLKKTVVKQMNTLILMQEFIATLGKNAVLKMSYRISSATICKRAIRCSAAVARPLFSLVSIIHGSSFLKDSKTGEKVGGHFSRQGIRNVPIVTAQLTCTLHIYYMESFKISLL